MPVDLSQVLQALIEGGQARERNLAEERERREEDTRQWMELLLKLVEEVQRNRGGGLDTGILRILVHWKLASVEEVI